MISYNYDTEVHVTQIISTTINTNCLNVELNGKKQPRYKNISVIHTIYFIVDKILNFKSKLHTQRSVVSTITTSSC